MLNWRALALVLCVLGATCVGERASMAAPTPIDWSKFDTLIADAKQAMMADPNAALAKAKAATALAEAAPQSAKRYESFATALWLEAEALTRINQNKEARTRVDQAIELASHDGKTTKLDGDLALSLARIADNDGDVALALKSYQKAHDIFAKLKEFRSQSIALQGLGSIYDEAHDFDREINYYNRASQVYSEDPALELSVVNNIGFAQQQLGHYDAAIKNFQRALDIAKSLKSDYLIQSVLTNLAWVYAKQHQFVEADKAANQAVRLLGKKDENGMAPFAWGVKASIEYERGALEAAEADLERAFHGVDLKTTIAPFRDMHDVAYKVYRAQGNPSLAMAHLEAFKRLDDQGRSLAASANLALMGAQFDFTNQKLEITQLKSEQLQRDMKLREQSAAIQRMIFAAILLALLAFAAWMGWRQYTLHKHRNAIEGKNVELTKTLGERDVEIVRRTEVEAQLRTAKRTAEQANVAKSHFLANMSHELRTPLNAIIGFSELITSEVFGAIGNEKYKGYAEDINSGGRNLLGVLNDILDMARIDAGTEVLADDEISLTSLLKDVIFDFQGEKVQGKSILYDRNSDDVWVRGDPRRLRQIVGNLVSNSVKFTPPQGEIVVRVQRVDDGVDVLISDNGIGIPADKLALVLEPFGQAESAYARSHGGIGLGLPIVRSLVEMHGGRFSLESKECAGTTARVHLPDDRMLKVAA